jgi:hypothetical protein
MVYGRARPTPLKRITKTRKNESTKRKCLCSPGSGFVLSFFRVFVIVLFPRHGPPLIVTVTSADCKQGNLASAGTLLDKALAGRVEMERFIADLKKAHDALHRSGAARRRVASMKEL